MGLAGTPAPALGMMVLLLLPLMLDETAAAARLAEIRAGFGAHGKGPSMAALGALGEAAPETAAGALALDWLGDLWRGEHDPARAEGCYRRAYAARDPEAHRLAARGLGDLALARREFAAAAALYDEARYGTGTAGGGASGALAIELDHKRALARRLRWRAVVEWAAWALAAAALVWFGARSRFWQRPRPRLPTEAWFVAPAYALLLLAAVGHDAQVLKALALLAAGSTTLIVAAGWAARRQPAATRAARFGHAALLAAANVALFYACCNRADLIDQLR